jgi:hypothetical protein
MIDLTSDPWSLSLLFIVGAIIGAVLRRMVKAK